MALRTVDVPSELEGIFAEAEKVVGQYFRERDVCPERGQIQILGERYVLVRAASLSVEFFDLVRDLYGPGRDRDADLFARHILFDLAHSIGRSDARHLAYRLGRTDPLDGFTVGPIHFSHMGWAKVNVHAGSRPVLDENLCLVFDHENSFEADAWLDGGKDVDQPVCIMNAGYTAGWCETNFGLSLTCAELLCRGRGDEHCRFILASPQRIEEEVRKYRLAEPALAPRIRMQSVPDLFARKRLEEELRTARDELEQRVRERTAELEEANERLRREIAVREQVEKKLLHTAKLEAIGRLAGGIAHDFNNLMGVVIGHSSMLEHRLSTEDPVRTQVTEIRQAGEQAATLTQQLLTFSRAQLVRRELVRLNEIVREMGRMLRRLIHEDLELEVSLGEGVGLVRADRVQLGQVIMNLALNARDAMRQGGRLFIETASVDVTDDTPMDEHDVSPGEWVMLCVTDTGVGMDDSTLAQAFDPFFTTKDVGEGTGLGLSTVYGIVAQWGGSISVSTAPSEGTRFRIYLPRVEAPEVSPEPPNRLRLPQGDETVLVVEDQPAVRGVVVEVLQGLGYRVLAAADPDEAIELASNFPETIDLILTDVVMPGMSGREMVDRLLTMRPGLRILYMSGYADDEVLRYGIQHGKADLVTKPFTPNELAGRVRRALDGSEEGGDSGEEG